MKLELKIASLRLDEDYKVFRIILEKDEILEVEFQCHKCKSRTIFPIEKTCRPCIQTEIQEEIQQKKRKRKKFGCPKIT